MLSWEDLTGAAKKAREKSRHCHLVPASEHSGRAQGELDMEFWTGLYLLSFLNMACCLPESSYTVHLNKRSFKNAEDDCLPGSFLTNIPNAKEMEKILKTIWDKNNKTTNSFWIGLKKDIGTCVKPDLPLKGFKWTVDNTFHSDVTKWKTEPSQTCTSARCGLLSVEYGASGVTSSGFMDSSCTQKLPFICKRNVKVKCPQPNISGTHDIIQQFNDPFTCEIVCSSGANFTLTCSKDLVWTVVGNENMNISQLCQECKKGYRRDSSGNCVVVNKCEESKPCDGSKPPTTDLTPLKPNVNTGKSVLTKPTSLPDDVRMNDTDVHIEESAGDVSNIIVPAIIALLIFIVLLVIVAAIVKGCLRRRSRNLAQRKAEAVALNGSSSMEKVNEKEET